MIRSARVSKTWQMRLAGALAVGALSFVPPALACSVDYLIWAIRDKTADSLFRFTRDGKTGYIDSTGRISIQPTLKGEGGNTSGEFHEGLLPVTDEHGYRYIDRSGKTVFRIDGSAALDFSGGLAPAIALERQPGWGFIDRAGRFAISPKYFAVDGFSEGLARVSVSGDPGNVGYINAAGEMVIPAKLSAGKRFHEGLAAVIMDGPCQPIDSGSCWGGAEYRPNTRNRNVQLPLAFIDKGGKAILTCVLTTREIFLKVSRLCGSRKSGAT